jgi:hypothetical protein
MQWFGNAEKIVTSAAVILRRKKIRREAGMQIRNAPMRGQVREPGTSNKQMPYQQTQTARQPHDRRFIG